MSRKNRRDLASLPLPGVTAGAASPIFSILREGDRPFVRLPYMGTLPLRPDNEHDFYVPERLFEFVFDWDAQGRVEEMLFGGVASR